MSIAHVAGSGTMVVIGGISAGGLARVKLPETAPFIPVWVKAKVVEAGPGPKPPRRPEGVNVPRTIAPTLRFVARPLADTALTVPKKVPNALVKPNVGVPGLRDTVNGVMLVKNEPATPGTSNCPTPSLEIEKSVLVNIVPTSIESVLAVRPMNEMATLPVMVVTAAAGAAERATAISAAEIIIFI